MQAIRFHGTEREAAGVPVIREVPLTVYYNGLEIITLLSTPDHLRELAVGFLKSEGFLESREDLLGIEADEEKGSVLVKGKAEASLARSLMEKRTITSGCGKGTTFYHALDALQARPSRPGIIISLERLVELTGEINREAMKARVAGGVHHAALGDADGRITVREDIGRHNAIDKLQGFCFLEGVPTADKFLLSTGRISSEILIKAGKMGVPLIVSLSKPTTLALELAGRLRITVVGNLRGHQGFIYTNFGHLG